MHTKIHHHHRLDNDFWCCHQSEFSLVNYSHLHLQPVSFQLTHWWVLMLLKSSVCDMHTLPHTEHGNHSTKDAWAESLLMPACTHSSYPCVHVILPHSSQAMWAIACHSALFGTGFGLNDSNWIVLQVDRILISLLWMCMVPMTSGKNIIQKLALHVEVIHRYDMACPFQLCLHYHILIPAQSCPIEDSLSLRFLLATLCPSWITVTSYEKF